MKPSHFLQLVALSALWGTSFMLTPRVEGRTLATVANSLQRLPTQEEIDKVARPLVMGISALHALNLVHANIGPDTILVKPGIEPLLTRPGGARAFLAARTRTVHACVTPGYSAPELYIFDPASQGPACDVFSLAATLYRLVMGRAPADVIQRNIGEALPSATTSRGTYRPEMLQAIDAPGGTARGVIVGPVAKKFRETTGSVAPVMAEVTTLKSFRQEGCKRLNVRLKQANVPTTDGKLTEFGFVLTSFALGQHILPARIAQTLTLVITLSMLLTPLSFLAYDWLARRFADRAEAAPADEIDDQQPIIIAGVGRFGQVVNRMVTMSGFKTTVLDQDLKTIELLRDFGFKCFVGDPTRPDLLKAAGIDTAKVLVVCLDGREPSLKLVSYARRERPDLHIIARARDREHVFELYRAGANDIVREYFDSSLRVGRYVLENMGLSEYEASELQKLFFKLDRASVRELAEVWRPGVPANKNAEYMARARELNRELETALVARFAQDQGTGARPDDEDGVARLADGTAAPAG